MGIDKDKLRLVFQAAATAAYGLNEVGQWLHIDHPGLSPYPYLPAGGDFVRNHASSFFGAIALACSAHTFLDCFWKSNKTALVSAFASAALLTAYESTIGRNGRMDWIDMAAYALALALSCYVNKPATVPVKNTLSI